MPSQIGGPAATLIGGGNNLYAVNPNGNIWQWDGTPNQWTQIGSPGYMFVAAGNNLFGITPNKQAVARYNGTPNQWTQIGGPAATLIAGGNNLYAVYPDGNIWQWSGTPNHWTQIGGPGYMFVAAGNDLFGITPDKQAVARYNGTPNQWTPIGGPAATLIGGGNNLYAVNPNGSIWQWDGTPNHWAQIGGPGYMFVAAGNDLFGITPDKQAVARYNGTPNQWTPIGGPADAIAASANNLFILSPGTHDVWAWKIPSVITVYNHGAYIARCSVTYTYNGQQQTQSSGNLLAAQSYSVTIPIQAVTIRILCQCASDLLHLEQPWKTIFDKTFPDLAHLGAQRTFSLVGAKDTPSYSEEGDPIAQSIGQVVVYNQGGYTAQCSVEYDVGGIHQFRSSGDFLLAQSYSVPIPAGATNIHVKCQENTGWIGDPVKTILDKTYSTFSPVTFTLRGTTLNPSFDEQ